jgi:hypothetical protein
MIVKFSAAVAGVLFFGQAVSAQTATASSTTLAKTAAKDPNRRVCRSQAKTGSRLSTARVCHTAAEWDEIERVTRMEIERQQAMGGITR